MSNSLSLSLFLLRQRHNLLPTGNAPPHCRYSSPLNPSNPLNPPNNTVTGDCPAPLFPQKHPSFLKNALFSHYFCIFLAFYLVVSEKSSTFAPDFVGKTDKTGIKHVGKADKTGLKHVGKMEFKSRITCLNDTLIAY